MSYIYTYELPISFYVAYLFCSSVLFENPFIRNEMTDVKKKSSKSNTKISLFWLETQKRFNKLHPLPLQMILCRVLVEKIKHQIIVVIETSRNTQVIPWRKNVLPLGISVFKRINKTS